MFQKNTHTEKKDAVTQCIATLRRQMEEMEHTLIHRLQDHKDLLAVKRNLDLPSVAGTSRSVVTQFNADDGYWSPIHNDPDKYVSVLSVLSKKKGMIVMSCITFVFRNIILQYP